MMINTCLKKLKDNDVQFLSVQNFFIKNGFPDLRLFEEDRVSLNQEGCRKLRTLVFEAAGFKRNAC